jgi:RasGEF domain/RasGEF N-terminal motif
VSICPLGKSISASAVVKLSPQDWIDKLGASLEKGPSEDRKRRPDDRTNMWAPPERPGETLFLREPREGGLPSVYSVRYATLNRLVELLTAKVPEQEKEHEKFTMVFLTTYQSFTTPETLMRKLLERFRVPCYAQFGGVLQQNTETTAAPGSVAISPAGAVGVSASAPAAVMGGSAPSGGKKKKEEEEEEEEELSEDLRIDYIVVMKQVCNALRHWFTNYFLDFNMATRRVLQEFVKESRSLHLSELDITTRFLEKTVTHKLEKGTFKSIFSSDLLVKNPPPPILPGKSNDPKKVDWGALAFMELNNTEIARQITIADYHLYADMQPVELLNLAWSKPRLKKRAANVLGLIERFNCFSSSVATLLLQCSGIKARRRMLTKVIEVMDELLLLNNFNAVMAFMSALNNSAVFRLKHTFAELKKPVFERFEYFARLFSSTQSFKSYRDTYVGAHPPAIPFLGVYLTDLTFIEDGNPDEVHGMVNYFKRTLVFDVIRVVRRYQTTCYNLKMVPQLQRYLNSLPKLSEGDMYEISLQLEPRKAPRKEIH